MKYRSFGKLDWEISAISLAVLQLDAVTSCSENQNPEQKIAGIRYAIDQGVNFITLGFPYYFKEPDAQCAYIKEALSEGYRDKVRLAVNIPSMLAESAEDLQRFLDEQLDWFGLDTVDFCVIEGLNRFTYPKMKGIGVRAWLDDALASGKVLHAGFALRDDAHYIKTMQSDYDQWTLAQIEYSFADTWRHPGAGGILVADDEGLGVVITGGLKDGRLLRNIPAPVQSIWDSAPETRTAADRALRWLLNDRHISTVTLDMKSPRQAEEYIAYAESISADALDIPELQRVVRAGKIYDNLREIACPVCRCCMPCPLGIDAPRRGEIYNETLMFGDDRIPEFEYFLEEQNRVRCVRCGHCETMCPKHFSLPDIQEKLIKRFESKEGGAK
jgi:predicted aldo/keto reductase-like oxidoreductase